MSSQMMQRSWWSAVAEAIKSFCALFVGVSTVLNESVDMASSSVAAARERQVIDLAIGQESYLDVALDQAASQRISSADEIAALLKGDPERITAFDSERVKLEATVRLALKGLASSRKK